MKIQSKLNTKLLVNVFPWVSLILVVAVFGVASKGLLFSAYNLKTIFSQSVLFIIGGLGLSFLFAQGAFDLSFGSVVCFASLLAAKAVEVTGVDLKSWPRCLYPDPRCFLPVEGNLYDTARTNRSY